MKSTNAFSLYNSRGVISSSLAKCREMWGLDHRSLALFRVLLGAVCFGDVLLKYGDVEAFYTDDGIISRKTMLEHFGAWYDLSFHTMSGGVHFQTFLFSIHLLLSALLIVGWQTRLVTILLYFFTRSIQDRLLVVLHSGDDVHRILLFWSMFLPLGACYSVDSCGGFSQLSSSPSSPSSSSKKINSKKPPFTLSTATFGLLLQMGILYFVSVFHKTGVEWRVDYTATFYAVNMDYYRTMVGDFFLATPPWVLQLLTFSVFWYEAIGPFLLIFPVVKTPWVRTFAAFGFAMLHVGLGACMRLGQFIWVCICVEFAYLPSQLWDWIENRLRTKERLSLRVYCNQPSKNISFSRFFATLFKTFFLIPETRLADLNSFDDSTTSPLPVPSSEKIDIENNMRTTHSNNSNTWLMVETLNGSQFKNAEAVIILYRHSPLLWPFESLVSLNIVKTLTNHIFSALQRLTTTDSTTSLIGIHIVPTPKKPRTASSKFRKTLVKILLNVFVGFLVFELVVWNLHTVSFIKAHQGLHEVMHIVGLEQNWKVGGRKDYSSSFSLSSALTSSSLLSFQTSNIISPTSSCHKMFSPGPPHHHFWHVIQATLESGAEVELFKDGALWNWTPNEPFTFDHPKDQFITYNSHPWYKFWESYNWNDEAEVLRLSFGRWVCREYNKRHGGTPRQLKTFNVWINWEAVNLDNTRTKGSREILWQHVC